MSESLDVLWAKKSSDDKNPKWLPLKQHLLDTGVIALNLYRSYLSDNQRRIIQNSIDQSDDEAEKLVRFIGSIHDIGKATPAFQSKRNSNGDSISKLDSTINNRLIDQRYFKSNDLRLNHQLADPGDSPHALAGEVILSRFGIDDDIGAIIGGHHGKTVDKKFNVRRQNDYPNNYYLFDDGFFNSKWKKAQNELVDWCLKVSKYDDKEEIPKIKDISAQIILEGLLVMADWIASNVHFFPLFSLDQRESDDVDTRLYSGWHKWYKDDQWRPVIHHDGDKYYQNRFGFHPLPLQERLFKVMDKIEHPGIVIIESGMGSGKTEAALATVEQAAKKDGDRGIFFCLPTQGSTNAMFTRIKNWADNISSESGSQNDIRLLHGKAALNDDFQSLPRTDNVGSDEPDANVLVNEWFTGNKTAILDNFVVGTVDQLLLLALKKKHLALRHLGLSQKVVVIDEAHSYDTYMQQYLYRALEWLGKYHVPVIILSATLPVSKREQMVSSYLDKKDLNWDNDKATAYPLITYSNDKNVEQLDGFEHDTLTSIQVIRFDEDKLIDKVSYLLSNGGIVGIIVNTVKRAQKIAEMFLKNTPDDITAEDIVVLHSSFIATSRMRKERELLNTIGKNGQRPHRKIVIGTQVLEQSLDVDFDVMFSDLAPMDLLLQRLGRMHRHRDNDPKRPEKLTKPRLYVMQTNDDYQFESGASFVYGDYLLMRTQYYLPDEILLPQSIAPLVQKVYDDEQMNASSSDLIDMDLSAELMDKYKHARKRYVRKIKEKSRRAKHYRLDSYDEIEDNLIGWLHRSSTVDDAEGLAQVRDSNDSIEVIIVKRTDDGQGYKFFNGDQDISNQIDDINIDKELAKNTLKLPNRLSEGRKIEKTIEELRDMNNEKLCKWQNRPFLRGSLGIILDKNNQFELNGFLLTYDDKLGLKYERSDDQ